MSNNYDDVYTKFCSVCDHKFNPEKDEIEHFEDGVFLPEKRKWVDILWCSECHTGLVVGEEYHEPEK